MAKLRSGKFLMALVPAGLLIANQGVGLQLPEQTVTAFAALAISYVLGEGAVDVARALRRPARP